MVFKFKIQRMKEQTLIYLIYRQVAELLKQ